MLQIKLWYIYRAVAGSAVDSIQQNGLHTVSVNAVTAIWQPVES